MTKIHESDVELMALEMIEAEGYKYVNPEDQELFRFGRLDNVTLDGKLKDAIDILNPKIDDEARLQAFNEVRNLPTQNLIENNEAFHQMLVDGIDVEYMTDDGIRGDKVKLIDFEEPLNNDFIVANQVTVTHGNITRRPDIVLYINGLPLVVLELKNPADENATVKKAYTQLQNYKSAIAPLFYYNCLLVASDGLDAKAGSLTAGWSRFMAWKTADGVREESITTPQIETLIKGMLKPKILLDLIKQFTVFEKTKKEDKKTGLTRVETSKIISAYHQYHAVNKAVNTTIEATKGSKKAGVVWHTQGSGKSLSMVFYSGKIVLALDNPTIVVITDRNDLDDQLFDTFAGCKQLLRQVPVQANNKGELKDLLKTSGGGIIFTTIQKFSPEVGSEYEQLSDRSNIIVIADEAHRSHYGFGAKVVEKDGNAYTSYGFAKYLRDAIPNASFVGFTGTPIEKADASTRSVFGNEIDVYDIEQAVSDGATVPIYYESRLVKVHLKPEQKELLDAEVEAVTEGEETTTSEKAKVKWTQLEAIVGHRERVKDTAKDIVEHYEKRQEVFEGKAMVVAMSRRIAVELYDEIIKLKPKWHSEEKEKGAIKVIMTSSSSDPENWQTHNTTKKDRKYISERFKDSSDPLKLVIVRDMWLTGFDAPCLHTMYIDKPMKGHNLMQAIARVNRVFKDKPGGLIVDYLGIASDLKEALAVYTESGGKGSPTIDQRQAIEAMLEKYEVVSQMYAKFDYKRYFKADTRQKMTIILEAQEHILGLDEGKDRYVKQVGLLSKAFALAVPSLDAEKIRDEVGFFQAVKARLIKYEPQGSGKTDAEVETAIRQIVDEAVVSEGVIDIFDAAGIKKPDISILSDDFLAEIKGMKQQNVALELLKKILGDDIKARSRKNLIKSKKFSEMLTNAIKRYQNKLITAAQVIEEMIEIAKEMKKADASIADLGLTEDEVAFYDALADNESAKEVMGDETLRELARILVQKVKDNTAIDWTIKDSVKAHLRVIIKRTLRRYGYPPDKAKMATENILKQAKLFAEEWVD